MFDYLQAVFWSITYILLIVYAFKYKTHAIPILAVVLNFSWETLALTGSILNWELTGGLIIHIAWFFLDLIIIAFLLFYDIYNTKKEKATLIIGYIISVVCLFFAFHSGYMLLSCFIIDLIMAILFLLHILLRKTKRNILSFLIGLFKLLGDMFAWLYYMDNLHIPIIGLCVLILNVGYLIVLVCKKTDSAPIQLARK